MLPNNETPMSQINSSRWLYPFIFFFIAILGLIYVKWNPYYYKAFSAAATHSVGTSILSGKAAAAPQPSWQAAIDYALAYFTAVWKAVVLGLLLGSLVQVLIPREWVKRVLGGQNARSTAIAGAASLPGMMCSCCAAPVAVGLRAQSASVGAALAFFLGNPVLNPATIIFMGFVLSWEFAVFRIIAGLVMVFGIATIANKLAAGQDAPAEMITEKQGCADGGHLMVRWLLALKRLVIDTIPAYCAVVLLLGAFRAWLFPSIGADWGNSLMVIIGLSVAGTLFVIPTAAEIPIVQSLLSVGLGVGPAAALLMTLPAVSLPSLLIIKRAFPKRVLAFVTLGVVAVGVISGIVASAIF